MEALLQQAVLALSSGAIVALAGLGVVQIYRGSGVLNFAHGAYALAAAQLFAWGWYDHGWPWPLAVGAAALLGGLLGLGTHAVMVGPLGRAPQLARIIATVGIMQVVQQASLLLFGSAPRQVGSFLPRDAVRVGGIHIQHSSLVLLAVVLLFAVALSLLMRHTRFGLVTQAAAHDERIARALGHRPGCTAGVNWVIGGALAGLAGALIVPIGGVAITSILQLAVPAFAAAVLGAFRSYLLTAVGAVAIAAAQGVFTYQAVTEDWPASLAPALPFIVVAVVLVLRSGGLPARDHVAARLPRVDLRPPPMWAWPVLVAVSLGALAAPVELANALVTTVVYAIIGLSLVVCTGLTGQISLAQFAIAGLGALAAARLSDLMGLPFWVCAPAGVAAAATAGALIAIPAGRTRGPALAVVTLGLGLAVQQGILADIELTGGFNGATPVERPRLLGLDVGAVQHPQRYAVLCLAVFGLATLAVANLGRSRVGRRLLAVRSDERAAAACGVGVGAAKVYAFAMASAIAGAGGVLLAFRYDTVAYSQFSFAASLQLITFVLIGGIGYLAGPLAGAVAVPNGLLAWAAEGVGDPERWLLLGSGALLIVVLARAPDGLVGFLGRARRADPSPRHAVRAPRGWPGRVLQVDRLGVRFGRIAAVDGVSLVVQPGRVTGLIGPNGAGKTTVIDAVSGFVPIACGRVRLGDVDLTRRRPAIRARAGVARCFQSIALFRDMSVRDNLLVGAERPRPHEWLGAVVHPDRGRLPDELVWLAQCLGIADVLDRRPEELSHGQRRLVGVARAVAGRPAVLLLDEPAAGLDLLETDRLGEVIRYLADLGMGVLLVEHDVDLVLRVSDHVVVMDRGRTIYDGPPGGVRDDATVRLAYLGDAPNPGEVDRTRVGPRAARTMTFPTVSGR